MATTPENDATLVTPPVTTCHRQASARLSRSAHQGRQVPTIKGIVLLRKLGGGGMGAVYHGVHLGLQQEVAVKILTLESEPEILSRFRREAQIGARIKSPEPDRRDRRR